MIIKDYIPKQINQKNNVKRKENNIKYNQIITVHEDIVYILIIKVANEIKRDRY